jgi:hypothetical protein
MKQGVAARDIGILKHDITASRAPNYEHPLRAAPVERKQNRPGGSIPFSAAADAGDDRGGKRRETRSSPWPETQVTNQAVRVDQPRPQQLIEPAGERVLAEQAVRVRRVQDPRDTTL